MKRVFVAILLCLLLLVVGVLCNSIYVHQKNKKIIAELRSILTIGENTTKIIQKVDDIKNNKIVYYQTNSKIIIKFTCYKSFGNPVVTAHVWKLDKDASNTIISLSEEKQYTGP